MNEQETWSKILAGLRGGDERACQDFWDLYSERLEKLACHNIAGGLRRRVGSESVALSVCRTFFRRTREGEFEISDSDDAWRLLCAITLNKIRIQNRDHHRQKRSLDREIHMQTQEGSDDRSWELASHDPSPEEILEFEEQLDATLSQLDELDRQILELKLQDYTNEETAEKLRCSEKTVRRHMGNIRHQLSQMLEI